MKVIPTEMELVAKSEDVKAMKAVISNKLLIIAHSESKKYWVPARYWVNQILSNIEQQWHHAVHSV